MKKILELLKRYETILVTVKAPESDLRDLREFIDKLDMGEIILDEFNPSPRFHFKDKTTKQSKINNQALAKTNYQTVADVYKKIKDDRIINDSEQQLITAFEFKHPNIREFLLVNIADLYNKVSEVGDRIWSLEELRLILFFHFDLKPNQTSTKADLLGMLKKNIYNSDYMDSMKKNYEDGNSLKGK
jgi:hypothetical protein